MKTSHGTIQGYNGQALVDKKHQVIIRAQAFGNAHDHRHLAPMMDGAKNNLKNIGESMVHNIEKIMNYTTV